MGSGKTYWGNRLAAALNVPFIDLDTRIERGENASIIKIFERLGESGFRNLERQYLQELAGEPAAIVATGGGTPCFFDNMAWMNQTGRSIYLNTPVQVLAARLRSEKSLRPLLKNIAERDMEAHIAQLLLHREQYYRQAHSILDQSGDNDMFWNELLKHIED